MSVVTIWQNCNGSTKAFLESIPVENYDSKPFTGRFKKFSWEFACIVRTRLCYIDAFRTSQLTFENRNEIKDKDFYELLAVEEMQELLHKTGVELTQLLRDEHSEELALWLMQHEALHQGKLLLYNAELGIQAPQRFKSTWGEDNFKRSS